MIRLLDDVTINKIAAGEVVEAPYSIVKELIENAIDAEAKSITLEIKEGGKKLIRITDDGLGIPEDEVEMAFQRHATSKINSLEDLSNTLSLGFRGEALASIAAVSQIEMITRPKTQSVGVAIEVAGGVITNKKSIGCPSGTTIMVKNLFYNTPARLKFLKSIQGETGKISEIITRLALSRPDISFKYINNNNIMFTTPGNNDLSQVILSVFQQDWFKSMLKVDEADDDIKVYGYIGQPNLYRGNRSYEIVFVNGRFIKSKLIYHTLERLYRDRIPINKFPVCVLNINIEPTYIDVNVHPSKTEIKFHDEEAISNYLTITLDKWLSKRVTIAKLEGISNIQDTESQHSPKEVNNNTFIKEEKGSYFKETTIMTPPLVEKKKDILTDEIQKAFKELQAKTEAPLKKGDVSYEEKESLQENFISSLLDGYKIIGQLFQSYILIEKGDGLYLMDQHAAHERLTYNRLIKEFKNNEVISQQLMEPFVLSLSSEDYGIIGEKLHIFKGLGFEIENFGQNTLIIRSVPLLMGVPRDFDFIFELIDQNNDRDKNYFEEELIKKACKESVKGMDRLSDSEIHSLLKDLSQLKPPLTCPHGRPILLMLSKHDIEKHFKRIQ
ncbi:DNA mismatch repair endonuclease MutL [Alkaliphilus serpentinus]|uniref:DNA mismatch repair protein MutL n=1 Tax=Alkaliphilus serpentinus TaxID=1482731 RepID=A0A833HM65_9FIRM|nr:DNA mismatch repair endonuclease MutL [Alkaliphilus serpentinus]KAB3527254.1 DNA mismatch repair endonuclease MutL [Alkaliphilus serpentinus]